MLVRVIGILRSPVFRLLKRATREIDEAPTASADHLRPTIMGSQNENQNIFPFIVQKPVGSAVGIDESFLYAAHTPKSVLRIQHLPPPRVLASQSMDHAKASTYICSIALRVLAAKFEGGRWSVSGGLV